MTTTVKIKNNGPDRINVNEVDRLPRDQERTASSHTLAVGEEIERRREYDKSLRPGEPVERNVDLLAHDTAATIGADQISARMRLDAIWTAHVNADRVAGLRHVYNFVAE